MRLTAIILALATCSTLATAAQAQRYGDDDDRGPPPRFDRGPPPREDYYRPRPDYDRPPPRFTCFVDPRPPFFPGRSCGTPPGRPHSSCHCGPFSGHREFDDRGHRDFDRRY